MTRTCTNCGTALAEGATARRRFCDERCKDQHRDATPERQQASRDRHRTRYQTDPNHRETVLKSDRERYKNDPEHRKRRRSRKAD